IEQMGAGRLPLRPADGGARRLRHRLRADLRRLPGARDRRHARPVLLVPRRLHDGLRAGQAPRPPQHRSQQRPRRRAHPVRDHRPPADRAAEEGKPPLKLTPPPLEFPAVTFAYHPGEKVTRPLSFVGEPGKVPALVGPWGGGKSTILNLTLRFYEVDGGAILVDGQNIAAVSRRSLRSKIAYVGQDVFLFLGTVRDNIAIGRPDRTQAQIIPRAGAAC